jgi:hypothetical protein
MHYRRVLLLARVQIAVQLDEVGSPGSKTSHFETIETRCSSQAKRPHKCAAHGSAIVSHCHHMGWGKQSWNHLAIE